MAANDCRTASAQAKGVGRQCAAALAATLVLLGLSSPAQADAIRDRQWHLDFLRADDLHDITTGKDVRVAVIDTGVDANHADLKGNVLEGSDFTGDGDAWNDDEGHGTAMASLIAGHGHGPDNRDGVLGLAPGAKILPGRIKLGGRGTHPDTDEAIDWAVKQGAGVMNLSFTGSGGFSHIENAFANDVVVVAGAGNTKQGGPGIEAPAAYPGVIAVSGVDRDGNFSKQSAYGPEVVLAAPMIDIMAAGAGKRGTYGTASGTSDATAIVSGVAALIRAKYPDISANGVINRLIKTADDKGPPGRDDEYGFGVINPRKALTADIPDLDYNPLIDATGPSRSVEASTAPAKDGRDDTEGTNPALPGIALAAAVLITASLGVYFFALARRNRKPPSPYGPFTAGSPPGGPLSTSARLPDTGGSWRSAPPGAQPDQHPPKPPPTGRHSRHPTRFPGPAGGDVTGDKPPKGQSN